MDSKQLISTFLSISKEITDKVKSSRTNSVKRTNLSSHKTKLYQICKTLKLKGPEIDNDYKQDMEKVQTELINLCQMTELDVEVRLMMLEIIELRASGWEFDEKTKEYYKHKFNSCRKSVTSNTNSRDVDADVGPSNVRRSQEDDVSPSKLLQSPTNDIVEELKIGDFKLTLKCSDRSVLQLSKQQLGNFFKASSQVSITGTAGGHKGTADQPQPRAKVMKINYKAAEQPLPALKYSREEILMIANRPQSKEPPLNWAEKMKKLPDVVLKKC